MHAQPGSGIRIGESLLMTPELSASYNWNNNVSLRSRALENGNENEQGKQSDSYTAGQVSLSLRHWNRSSQTLARGWYNIENYKKFDDLSEPSYGGSLSWFWARPGAETTIKSDFSQQIAVDKTEQIIGALDDSFQTQELESIADRVQREETKAKVTVDQELIKDVRSDFTYSYSAFNYDDERYNDRVNQIASIEANYQFTPKTQPYLRLGYGWDEDEGFAGIAEKPFFLTGARFNPSDKLRIDAAGGYETYTRTPTAGLDAGNELHDAGIKWSLSVKYIATHKTRFSLNGRNGYNSVASEGSSSRRENSVSLALDHQTTRQFNQRLSVSWREDDYLSLIPSSGGTYDELKETWMFQYSIDYQTVRPWLRLFAKARYEDGSSRIPGDSYTQAEVTVGLKAQY
ncbi:MAG: outer membrane beta-barrel protein [Alphaproteobacteria bacterium]